MKTISVGCQILAAALMLLVPASSYAFECTPLMHSDAPVDSAGFGQGLLWRVERDGAEEPNYLFGTIHIADQRVTRLAPEVAAALANSAHFGMEVVLNQDAIQKLFAAMAYGDGRNLLVAVGPQLFASLLERLQHYDVDRAGALRLKPWAAYMTLSLPPGQSGVPLDLALMLEAKKRGKRVFGLESIAEQIDVFESLSEPEQIEVLTESLCHYDFFQSLFEDMVRHYVARDVHAILALSQRYSSPLHDRFMEVLLDQRNLRMTERMRPELDRGGAFIAIGALHLPGPDGVLARLREAGYRLSVVY